MILRYNHSDTACFVLQHSSSINRSDALIRYDSFFPFPMRFMKNLLHGLEDGVDWKIRFSEFLTNSAICAPPPTGIWRQNPDKYAHNPTQYCPYRLAAPEAIRVKCLPHT